jgi:hypothetical protein
VPEYPEGLFSAIPVAAEAHARPVVLLILESAHMDYEPILIFDLACPPVKFS